MSIQSLNELPDTLHLEADLVIVGGGPCGLTLARELAGSGLDILLLESGGLGEDEAHEALNTVDMVEGCWSAAEIDRRNSYHRNLTTFWDGARQSYGLRCRGLGGSTQTWAGKSAPFEEIDLEARPWVPLSGWPIPRDELAPFVSRAEALLNLGPGPYDGSLWARIGRHEPAPPLAESPLRSLFWKFARSRRSATDIMRFGADFAADPPAGVRVLTDATATRLLTSPDGRAITGVEAKSLSGNQLRVSAETCVLAANTIENIRLLLLSRDANPAGLGNETDCVGRYLIDHPTATVARFDAASAGAIAARFGLYGHREGGHTHIYMHGLGLDPAWQRAEHALNGAIFVTEERAPDDPFSALKRLLKRRSEAPFKDMFSVARAPMRLGRGAMARAMERGYIPKPISRVLADVALRIMPNTLAQDFQNGTLPLKLAGLRVEATTEQPPLAENRITLSDSRDALGLERARVRWTAGDAARMNLLRIGQAFEAAFRAEDLPDPVPCDWVRNETPEAAVAIDLGHAMGGTRMSDDPATGVVNRDCRVHGVTGLYIAGGSVMPTSGHANPTLMFLALALRLADHLKASLPRR